MLPSRISKGICPPQSDRLGVVVIPVTEYRQNCSLIWCKRSAAAAVVDPGGDIDLLLAEAGQRGLRIESVLLSHGHRDHAGGAATLSHRTGAHILGPHVHDRFLLEKLPSTQVPAPGDRGAGWLDRVQWLADADTVTVGEVVFDVRHCPGHTPGHVAFVQREARLAWVGDLLFAGTIGNTASGYGNLRELVLSIVNGLWPFGDDIRFVPGHGRMSTFGAERCLNPFVSDVVVESLNLASTSFADHAERRTLLAREDSHVL